MGSVLGVSVEEVLVRSRTEFVERGGERGGKRGGKTGERGDLLSRITPCTSLDPHVRSQLLLPKDRPLSA